MWINAPGDLELCEFGLTASGFIPLLLLHRRGGVHLGKGGPRPPRKERGGFWDTEGGAARGESPFCGDISGLLSWQQSAGGET